MLTKNEILSEYLEYLEESGVNTKIIKYLEKNPYLVRGKLKELIGEDLYPMYKDVHIEMLKKGNETFKITEDGELWWKDERMEQCNSNYKSEVKIAGVTHSFYHGHSMLADPNRKKISEYYNISVQDGHIVQRELSVDDCQKDGEKYYNGRIVEKFFNDVFDLEEENSASWEKSDSHTIPDKDILTRKKIFGKGYFKDTISQTETYNKNYAEDLEWQYVLNGKTQGEKLQSEINEITKKSNIMIDGVKNFFNKLRNNTRDFEK